MPAPSLTQDAQPPAGEGPRACPRAPPPRLQGEQAPALGPAVQELPGWGRPSSKGGLPATAPMKSTDSLGPWGRARGQGGQRGDHQAKSGKPGFSGQL